MQKIRRHEEMTQVKLRLKEQRQELEQEGI